MFMIITVTAHRTYKHTDPKISKLQLIVNCVLNSCYFYHYSPSLFMR